MSKLSLLKEVSSKAPSKNTMPLGAISNRPDLKDSDSSDAGSKDVFNKIRSNDVSFSSMRNTINSDGKVTGSDIANYLERAAEINDEVDVVPFGLETDDGDIVKVYVNAEQAEGFEEALKKLLGLEDDIEEAINKLAQEFDIVDVVWPKDKNENASAEAEFDSLDDEEEPMETVGMFDPLEESINFSNFRNLKALDASELSSFRKISSIISNLSEMGPGGVSISTGLNRSDYSKNDMIRLFMNDKYKVECSLIRESIKRSNSSLGAESDLPFWLREDLA